MPPLSPSGQRPLETAILSPTRTGTCEACRFHGRKPVAPLKLALSGPYSAPSLELCGCVPAGDLESGRSRMA
jgi:hypothetical protein